MQRPYTRSPDSSMTNMQSSGQWWDRGREQALAEPAIYATSSCALDGANLATTASLYTQTKHTKRERSSGTCTANHRSRSQLHAYAQPIVHTQPQNVQIKFATFIEMLDNLLKYSCR